MNEFNMPNQNHTIFLNGKELAKLLKVSPPTLSVAAKNGYMCGGYPVIEWVEETDTGRILGYDVPDFLVYKNAVIETDAPETPETRYNPDKEPTNLVSNSTNLEDSAPPTIQNNYSLLPKGENYFQPVSVVVLTSLVKKAMEKDTPQSRAVIASVIMMLGAISGHAVTGNKSGAGIGALAGLGTAFISYSLFSNNKRIEPPIVIDDANKQQVAVPEKTVMESAFYD